MGRKRVWLEPKSGGGTVKHTTTYIPPKRAPRRRRGGCLPISTRVLTPFGWKLLADITAGDAILSASPRTGRLTQCTVVRKLQFAPTPVIELFGIAGLAILRATGSHTVLTSRGWRAVAKLTPGDLLLRATPTGIEQVEIATARTVTEQEPVVNLHTSNLHTFIVEGGVVAHNFTAFRAFRTFLHRLVFDQMAAVRLAFC